MIWTIAWWFAVFDTPAQHKRISAEERAFIEDKLGTQNDTETKVRGVGVGVYSLAKCHFKNINCDSFCRRLRSLG